MERNIFSIMFINAGSRNNGTSNVSADIFDSDVRCTEIGFGTDIESFRMFFVQSGVGHWRIQHDYEKVKNVYRENFRVDTRMDYTAQKINHGFHKQKGINQDSLAKVLQYIAGHDKGVAKGTYYKKRGIDILFEQIERERTAKNEEIQATGETTRQL